MVQFRPGEVVDGYVLAEDNQWYRQPPPWPAGRQVDTAGGALPSNDVTGGMQAQPNRRPGPVRPSGPGPAYTLWWWWAGVFVILVLVGVVLGSMYVQTYFRSTSRSSAELGVPTEPVAPLPWQTPDPVAAGGLGVPVRDAEVEFTVTAVDCSRTQLGEQAKVSAQGTFCVLSVQATNKGNTSVALPTAQDARARDGIWLVADYVALAYLGGPSLYSTQLEPSATASGALVFDVMRSETLTVVRLRAHADSTGVVVKLS